MLLFEKSYISIIYVWTIKNKCYFKKVLTLKKYVI